MLKDRLRCLLNMHQPVRHKVNTETPIYRGHCQHCCQPIYREAPRRWREDRLAKTGGLPRANR